MICATDLPFELAPIRSLSIDHCNAKANETFVFVCLPITQLPVELHGWGLKYMGLQPVLFTLGRMWHTRVVERMCSQ